MCDASELRAVVPEDVGSTLEDAIRAARLHAGRPLTPAEALVEVARAPRERARPGRAPDGLSFVLGERAVAAASA